MHRIILLLALVLTGCFGREARIDGFAIGARVVVGAVLELAGGEAPSSCDDPDVRCISADQARREDAARTSRVEDVMRRAWAITRAAGAAARAGDCEAVRAFEREVWALPPIPLEGGVHDTVFLRLPEIGTCLQQTIAQYHAPW